jgi:AcrR family transcriptional regulator
MRPRRPFDFDAIATAFADTGYDAATMARIAERAGVAKRTLYHHFGSKERLFEATVAALCDDVIEQLFAAYERAEQLPLEEGIRVSNGAWLEYARAHPAHFRLLFRTNAGATPAAARQIDRTMKSITDRVAEMFRKDLEASGAPAGQVADILAAITTGAAERLGQEMASRSDWDADAVLGLLTDLWTQALRRVSRHALAAANRPTPTARRRGSRTP